ncbi:MAG: ferritin-like domain-containing protein [Lysobacterales bacterium]|nr:MAG: ferritin-like domain-containing protein [Xanthomonadales bacterium]
MQDASTRITLQNRTGVQRSPQDFQDMLDGMEEFQPQLAEPDPGNDGIAEVRAEYISEQEPLGTIPPPATPTGMAKSAMKMLTGNRMQVLVDKLAERLAFERTGTRLYDALIAKYETLYAGSTLAGRGDGNGADADDYDGYVSRETLVEVRNQEAEHFMLVADAIRRLGADPTAETPCADSVGVQSIGLVQTVSDPRTSLAQSLNAMLTAELADNAGWELLIQLAESLGQDEMADQFRDALATEARHLQMIRSWLTLLVMAESGNAPAIVR